MNTERGRDDRRARLLRLLEPVVAAAGAELEDIEIVPAGRRRVLRVVIDGDGGVSLDDIASVSRSTSDALDGSEVMGAGPYVLEVTSPGVDRPLTRPRHWRRAIGRLVRVSLAGGGEITGRVVDADDAAVVLEIDGDHRRCDHSEILRGRMQVEFQRPRDGSEDAGA